MPRDYGARKQGVLEGRVEQWRQAKWNLQHTCAVNSQRGPRPGRWGLCAAQLPIPWIHISILYRWLVKSAVLPVQPAGIVIFR